MWLLNILHELAHSIYPHNMLFATVQLMWLSLKQQTVNNVKVLPPF